MLLAVHTCRDFLNLLATCEPFSLNFSNSIGEWRHRTPHDTLPYSLRRDQLSLIARWLLQPIHRHRSGRLWLAHKTRARGVGSICRLVLNLEAASGFAADEREAQEVEGFRLAEPAPFAALRENGSHVAKRLRKSLQV